MRKSGSIALASLFLFGCGGPATVNPEAAIIFDNLHSLHDDVSDILANPAIPRDAKRKTILEAAAHYRDDHTSVTTVSEWREMAEAMGVEKMGGRPSFGTIPADSSKSPNRLQ